MGKRKADTITDTMQDLTVAASKKVKKSGGRVSKEAGELARASMHDATFTPFQPEPQGTRDHWQGFITSAALWFAPPYVILAFWISSWLTINLHLHQHSSSCRAHFLPPCFLRSGHLRRVIRTGCRKLERNHPGHCLIICLQHSLHRKRRRLPSSRASHKQTRPLQLRYSSSRIGTLVQLSTCKFCFFF